MPELTVATLLDGMRKILDYLEPTLKQVSRTEDVVIIKEALLRVQGALETAGMLQENVRSMKRPGPPYGGQVSCD